MAFESSVTQVVDNGNPQPSYKLRWRDTTGGQIPTYLARDFGISTATIVQFTTDWRVNSVASRSRLGFGIMRDANGVGPAVMIETNDGSNWFLRVGQAGSWAQYGSFVASSAAINGSPLAPDTWLRMFVTATVNADGSLTLTAKARTTADVDIATVTATLQVSEPGDFCGAYSTYDQLGSASEAWIDNIHVQASGSTNAQITNVATSYVYTLVNDLGEQSAPSPASSTVLRPDGVSVTVTTSVSLPTGISADYGIETKRIYRAVTGATGSIFRFVAEIPLSQADYVDTLTDAQLGEELESDGWDLPPDDLRGILALPNGIMVGFRRNQLCFSAQNRPHAWPPAYRLNTDTDIVAIGAIDTAVVVGTKSFPYVAQGQTPADYAMAKLEVPQACVSKRGLTYIAGIGVVFPSPDGYMAIAGVSAPVNVTRLLFTRKQWQALNPESIIASAHDDVLHFFYDSGPSSARAGYALDFKPDGFGVISLAYHATAVHADPVLDALYLVLDENDEPAAPYLAQSTAPVPDGQTLYQFDGDETSLMTYLYRGRLNLMPQPYAPSFARVQADDFDNLLVRAYQDGVLQFEQLVTSAEEFRVPTDRTAKVSYEQEIVGTSRVRTFQTAEDIEEID